MGVKLLVKFCSNFKLYWPHNLAEFNHVDSKLPSWMGKSLDGAWWIHKSGMCQIFSSVTWFLCVHHFMQRARMFTSGWGWSSGSLRACSEWWLCSWWAESQHRSDHTDTITQVHIYLLMMCLFVLMMFERTILVYTKHSFKWWFISVLLPADMHPTWGRTWVDKLSWRVWIAFAFAHLARCGGYESRTNFKHS